MRRAQQLLFLLDIAKDLNDLRPPPGNRSEKLAGDRTGQYSVRINKQWRICFNWTDAGPEQVEIADYHQAWEICKSCPSAICRRFTPARSSGNSISSLST
ncbi:MAG: type II toxin-antitoxin system RelE/ParE family toxin [Rhizobiaceae bacterium]|nr:type II toxin-antitoxin system RelE/ParE family toxin [Rhizobiaceae bacterium]